MDHAHNQNAIQHANRLVANLAVRPGARKGGDIVALEHKHRPVKPDAVLGPVGAILGLVQILFYQI